MNKFLLLALVILFVSCAPQHIDCASQVKTVGFWYGLWHGVITPVTFVISLFSDSVEIYAVNNNGGWYNFGFVIGLGLLGGGGSRA